MIRFPKIAVLCGFTTALVAAALLCAQPSVRADGKDEGQKEPAGAGKVDLTKVASYQKLLDVIAENAKKNKKVKYTMVDAWATWCSPCVENFPHVVEMHKKYASQGLAVASLTFDDVEDSEKVLKFLRKENAAFTNFIPTNPDEIFEKLEFTAIPAVFLFGPDGKLVKKYTMDDPDNQFTYDQVENEVKALLSGKSIEPVKNKKKANKS